MIGIVHELFYSPKVDVKLRSEVKLDSGRRVRCRWMSLGTTVGLLLN